MRKTILQQLSLVSCRVDHPHARELAKMSEVLDELPQVAELVAADLARGTTGSKAGRDGMTGEQVLRAALLKQMHGWSYYELAFHLADSDTFRTFCRMGMMDQAPKKSTLAGNIKRVKPASLEQVNRHIISFAKKKKVEDGKKARIDSTVMDSNIHHPLDSHLLFDVVRTLTRLLVGAQELVPELKFSNHTKRAKRRMLDIANARNMKSREPLYGELLSITQWSMDYATAALPILATAPSISAMAMETTLRHYLELGSKVVDQTQRRVFQGESVPADEKIVSIFEPHTDVIVKDRRQTRYGHKVFLNVGASGMIIDMLIERGNPSDSTRAIPMLERHRDIMEDVPQKAAFDAGFTSAANIDGARKLGVQDAYFAGKGSIDVSQGASKPRTRKKLRCFRAGVEGIISFTKRCFGFGRCTWSGYFSFQAYAWTSVISTNLLLLARRSSD